MINGEKSLHLCRLKSTNSPARNTSFIFFHINSSLAPSIDTSPIRSSCNGSETKFFFTISLLKELCLSSKRKWPRALSLALFNLVRSCNRAKHTIAHIDNFIMDKDDKDFAQPNQAFRRSLNRNNPRYPGPSWTE